MFKSRKYSKNPLPYQDLLEKLRTRGLLIEDCNLAERHLRNIGYYRFTGYGLPFEKKDKEGARTGRFLLGTTFQTLVNAYVVDSHLRILVLGAIEQIEVAIRNIINHELGCKYNDAHWYLEKNLFKQSERFKHANLLDEIKRQTGKSAKSGSDKEKLREVFIHHYYGQYDTPEYPPCWMIGEVLSLGSWSKIYEHLAVSKDRKVISKQIDLNPATLQSWLHSLTYLRNICAHHCRLFARRFVIHPNKAKNLPIAENDYLFNFVCITYYLLKKLSPETRWLDALTTKLANLDEEHLKHYRFQADWLEHSFWLGQPKPL